MKEVVGADGGHEQIWQAIVVIIAHRDAHSVEAHIQSRTSGHICEMAFSIVLVEGQCGWLFSCRNMVRPIGRIDKEQILSAVVVEIKKSNASSHALREQFVTISSVIVDKADARRRGNLCEFRCRNLCLRM